METLIVGHEVLAGACGRTPRFLVLSVPLFLSMLLGASCQRKHSLTPAADSAWKRDSARYVQVLAKWVRDSIVRDSISRTINTDSLYRTYRRMLRADNPIPLKSVTNCEEARLLWRYGATPALAAFDRMNDTLWRPDERHQAAIVAARIQNATVDEMTTLGVGRRRCGDWGYHQPEIVNGTNVDDVTGKRPLPPRRP